MSKKDEDTPPTPSDPDEEFFKSHPDLDDDAKSALKRVRVLEEYKAHVRKQISGPPSGKDKKEKGAGRPWPSPW